MSSLSEKTILITGGGSGIGFASARVLLQAGARVAIAGRDETKLRRAAESLGGGERILAVAANVADSGQVASLVDQVRSRFGPVDILVNNAGLNIKERGIRELTPEAWRRIIQTNLDGAFYCIHAVLPEMLKRRDGYIINICSTSGKRASPLGGAAYGASKFGMNALGTCIAAEEQDNGLRVCTIYPGEVNTPILDARPTPLTDEQRRRMLQPEDVAAAVLFAATLPPHVAVPELVIKPIGQVYI